MQHYTYKWMSATDFQLFFRSWFNSFWASSRVCIGNLAPRHNFFEALWICNGWISTPLRRHFWKSNVSSHATICRAGLEGRRKDARQHCELQAGASSGAVVTCVAGTCAPAAGLKWPQMARWHLSWWLMCVCQARSGSQQMVVFTRSMWSKNLWR